MALHDSGPTEDVKVISQYTFHFTLAAHDLGDSTYQVAIHTHQHRPILVELWPYIAHHPTAVSKLLEPSLPRFKRTAGGWWVSLLSPCLAPLTCSVAVVLSSMGKSIPAVSEEYQKAVEKAKRKLRGLIADKELLTVDAPPRVSAPRPASFSFFSRWSGDGRRRLGGWFQVALSGDVRCRVEDQRAVRDHEVPNGARPRRQ